MVVNLVGTVIASNMVLTAATPFANVSKESIVVDVEKSVTCPQWFTMRGKKFNVTDILFHPLYLGNKYCHNIAVLVLDGDLTKVGAQIATINWSVDKIERNVGTFKCLANEGGIQAQTVTVTNVESHPCALIETEVGKVCSHIGSPLIYDGDFVGVQIACRPCQKNVAVYASIVVYKSFLKPIIEGGAVEKVSHNEMVKAFEQCPNRNHSKEVETLKTLINESGVCDSVKVGLIQVLYNFVTIDYKHHAETLNIPQLLVLEDEKCEDTNQTISSSPRSSSEPKINITIGTRTLDLYFKDDINLQNTHLDPFYHLNSHDLIQLQPKKMIGSVKEEEKVENYFCENMDSSETEYKFKPVASTKNKLGSILSVVDVEMGDNKNSDTHGKLANIGAAPLRIKVIPAQTNRTEEGLSDNS